ncbi:hypothetical protein BG011_003869 [Mortierella polycephala]|uniref:Uncharacterized protein n=1 Tax=Mortierella polycephala TaxID=41804 RepID=A0A9P6Q2K6_9FUNG|nr:hypothetical protein BG011_003869 [Mortierella polycephala]
MSTIRQIITKIAVPAARRSISNSSKTNSAASASLGRNASMASSASPSSSSRTLKTVAYTIVGSTVVVASVSHLLKDEVVYWTPNPRK